MTTSISNLNGNVSSEAFEQVLGQLQAARQGLNRARVLGVVGCRNGDGTTYVVGTLARLLAARSHKRVLQADCADLMMASRLTPSELLVHCWFTEQDNLWLLSRPDGNTPSYFRDSEPEGELRTAFSVLDSRFDFILLDCGAVTASGRLWQLASLIDDVLLVVAAGETKRNQVIYAQRIIEQAGAHLAGCILNKRTYPLPSSIHQLLS